MKHNPCLVRCFHCDFATPCFLFMRHSCLTSLPYAGNPCLKYGCVICSSQLHPKITRPRAPLFNLAQRRLEWGRHLKRHSELRQNCFVSTFFWTPEGAIRLMKNPRKNRPRNQDQTAERPRYYSHMLDKSAHSRTLEFGTMPSLAPLAWRASSRSYGPESTRLHLAASCRD